LEGKKGMGKKQKKKFGKKGKEASVGERSPAGELEPATGTKGNHTGRKKRV